MLPNSSRNSLTSMTSMNIIFRLLINSLALLALTQLIEGLIVDNFYAALIASIVIGLLNTFVRPILLILTLPVNIISLGLFTFIVNGLMIWFASTFLQGFAVQNFWVAVLVAIILWIISLITNYFILDSKKQMAN
jgi:putative membrane protein